MKIEIAIETQEQYLTQRSTHISNDLDIAIKLGIEALKRVESHRFYGLPSSAILLLGETKD